MPLPYASWPAGFDPAQSTVARAVATCPVCGGVVEAKTTRRLFQEGQAGQRMVAVVLKHPLHGNAASPHGNAVPPQQTERFGKPVPGSIPTIVRSFKSAVTRRINQLRDTQGTPVWQRNYFEHIVRNEHTLNAIRQYILNNPHRWPLDRYNPDASGPDPKAQDIWATLRREQAGESKL